MGRGNKSTHFASRPKCTLAIRRIQLERLGDLALPAVAVGQELLLVIVELFARFGGELEVRSFDDGIDRAGFLAEAAVDAFVHVDVVARGAARSVCLPRACFDDDALRRADRLA